MGLKENSDVLNTEEFGMPVVPAENKEFRENYLRSNLMADITGEFDSMEFDKKTLKGLIEALNKNDE